MDQAESARGVAMPAGARAGDPESVLSQWRRPALTGLILLALLAVAPSFMSSYSLRFAALAFMYLALAQSWNLIGGYGGLMSLAMPAFFGSGAIVSGILVTSGVHAVPALAGGTVAALLVAAVIAVPTLRLQGHYFVVATILITEALRHLLLNVNAFGFAGNTALNLFNFTGLSHLQPKQYNEFFYYAMLALALVAMAMVGILERSRWGYALRSVRDNERAAGALGIAAARQKLYVFLLSAGMAAVVGGTWAFWLGTVETNDAFSFTVAFDVIVMVFLGGRGTVWGPVAGVGLVLAVNEWIGVGFPEIHLVISGLLVAFVVLFLPDGLISLKSGFGALAPAELMKNLRRYQVK
ncbi:MAG: branched-chain amino acid transporter permease [Paucimonas sp.]|nr:branched-chain amino acid transporter permease [Paucimonas sp.]